MALCVRPPPQGFSQARCSSKSVTSNPSRASRSPQMDPEGPPPTIATSRMRVPWSPIGFPAIAQTLGHESRLRQRKNGRKKPGSQYSTEQSGRRGRTGAPPHRIGAKPVEDREDRYIRCQQQDENLAGAESECNDGEDHCQPEDQPKAAEKKEAKAPLSLAG